MIRVLRLSAWQAVEDMMIQWLLWLFSESGANCCNHDLGSGSGFTFTDHDRRIPSPHCGKPDPVVTLRQGEPGQPSGTAVSESVTAMLYPDYSQLAAATGLRPTCNG